MSFVDGDETPSSDEPDDQERMTRLVTEVYERQLAREVEHEQSDPVRFMARHLGASADQVVEVSEPLGPITRQLVARVLSRDMAVYPPVRLLGVDHIGSPQWGRLVLAHDVEAVPTAMTVAFAAGAPAEVPLLVKVSPIPLPQVTVVADRTQARVAQDYLESVLHRARDRADNPFYLRVLQAAGGFAGLDLAVVASLEDHRDDLVFPEDVWVEIDTNVHGFFARREQLEQAGLGGNRGVLLAGPPGTGKTALCRVLASELAGKATLVFCDSSAIHTVVAALYDEIHYLTPAVVFMEDIDLVVADRDSPGRGSTVALADFLNTLDGAMSRHSGVVTVATTNDPSAIDPAARRAARFDRIVHVPMPDLSGRAKIIERYLRHLDASVDTTTIAGLTEGATGADLRELVRLGVLSTTGPISTEDLGGLARTGRWRPAEQGGYL